MNELYQRNKIFYLAYLGWLLISVAALALFSKTELFNAINGNRSPLADAFYAPVTHLGDGFFFIAVILALLFIKVRYAIMGASAYALSSAITQTLKRVVFDEPRPAKFFEGIQPVYTVDGTELFLQNSFPSGHATTAFAIACLLSLIVANKKWQLLFFVLAVFAALSRVYLGQHFFADITLGGFIGVVSSTVCVYRIQHIQRHWLEKRIGR
jgi:membrane-associated phospholipid phosphatase